MRLMLGTVEMNGVVVIGEGEKDEAPMLYNGEEIGYGHGPAVDVAVDPLEGTRLTALGQPNAIAVIAVAERGTMFDPGAAFYMDKIAVGPRGGGGDRHQREPDRERPRGREGEGARRHRGDRRRARARPPRRADRRAAPVRRARQPDPRRRRRPLDRSGAGVRRRRHADGDRRHPGGRHLRRGDQVPARRDPGQALAAQRRRAPEARRLRLRHRPRAHDRRPRLGRRCLRRRHRRHERRLPPRRARQRRRRRDRVDRDALPLGHCP